MLTYPWHAASHYVQSSDIQTVENNVLLFWTLRRLGKRFYANDVTNDSSRPKRLLVTTHGRDQHSVISHL